MEERVLHPSQSNHHNIIPPPSSRNDVFPEEDPRHETHGGVYVVQVPKVQIYRVPPPENAKFVERFRNAQPHKRPCSVLFSKCFILSFIIVLVLGICAALAYLAVKPKTPTFSIEHLTFKNITSHSKASKQKQKRSPSPEYRISLESDNPNNHMNVIYEKDGSAELSFKNHNIATGKTQAMTLNTKDSGSLELVLAGTKTKMPSEMEKRLHAGHKKTKVGLLLTVSVPMKMEIGFVKLWSMKIVIECDFQVNTLSESTHVMNQKCKVKVEP